VQADRQVPQRGHDQRTSAGADVGQVLGEGHVPHPVQPVLDLPMVADRCGEFIGSRLVRGEVGDRVDGLGAPTPFRPVRAESGRVRRRI
jgi:hypothetical protein